MNVSELIKELETFKEDYGDLPVRLFTDHSQVHMKAQGVTIQCTEDLSAFLSDPVQVEFANEGAGRVCEVFAC